MSFPPHFFWGTSTAAAQIETAGDHPWRGVKAFDGEIFVRTADHELRRSEDAAYIARLGSVYRCGVDWSRLQRAPMATFDPDVVAEYQTFFEDLRSKGVRLMFVLHHFCHPNWFEAAGGWASDQVVPWYLNYTEQCVTHFGSYAGWWNTFNEPNVFVLNAYLLGNFPPFVRGRYSVANHALDRMGRAHDSAYHLIKTAFPSAQVGISLNTAVFEGANLLGRPVAAFMRWWFLRRAARPFERCDFWGLSYYAHVLFDPFPIDVVARPGAVARTGLPHDDMWLYKPEGLGDMLRLFYRRYGKPVVVTENGICTDDPQRRIQSLRDYLSVCQRALDDGVDLRGYIHWSTFDNFEWHLGPGFRFGLVRVERETMQRVWTDAAAFYSEIVQTNCLPR
ncbi:MAG: family 1 glycosylhydrolase [Saprospiraceae bacterium]|nr:family 1 glycosylhydrolase [Saprospiraceae bacterium]